MGLFCMKFTIRQVLRTKVSNGERAGGKRYLRKGVPARRDRRRVNVVAGSCGIIVHYLE